jgi:hypothetical protein
VVRDVQQILVDLLPRQVDVRRDRERIHREESMYPSSPARSRR